MTLTKALIAEAVWNNTGIPKWRSAELVDTLLEVIKESLELGEDVLVSGFGKFSVREKQERKGRNPQTDEAIMLSARKVVTFKCAGVLKDKINGKG